MKKNFKDRIVYAKTIVDSDTTAFEKSLEQELEFLQNNNFIADIQYSTVISQYGITHTALIVGKIGENTKKGDLRKWKRKKA